VDTHGSVEDRFSGLASAASAGLDIAAALRDPGHLTALQSLGSKAIQIMDTLTATQKLKSFGDSYATINTGLDIAATLHDPGHLTALQSLGTKTSRLFDWAATNVTVIATQEHTSGFNSIIPEFFERSWLPELRSVDTATCRGSYSRFNERAGSEPQPSQEESSLPNTLQPGPPTIEEIHRLLVRMILWLVATSVVILSVSIAGKVLFPQQHQFVNDVLATPLAFVGTYLGLIGVVLAVRLAEGPRK
jgi:hypothetical protein